MKRKEKSKKKPTTNKMNKKKAILQYSFSTQAYSFDDLDSALQLEHRERFSAPDFTRASQ
jgi:hypothetical protein